MKNYLQNALTFLVFLTSIGIQAQDALSIANKQYELNAYDEAAKAYKVLVENPNTPPETKKEAMARMADCFYYTNELEQAKIWYSKALAIGYNENDILLKYGHTLRALGDLDEAAGIYSKYDASNQGVGAHYAAVTASVNSIEATSSNGNIFRHPLSSASSDFGPAVYNNSLIFSSAREDKSRQNQMTKKSGNIWNKQTHNELFTTLGLDKAAELKHLRSDLRNEENEGPLAYSPDGKTVVFTKNAFVTGNRPFVVNNEKMSLYVAKVKDNGDWEDAKPFEHNGLSYSTGYPAFSQDGNTLYFISNRPDGLGGFDIYRSSYQDGKWGIPTNIGYPVNTPGNEVSPFVSEDKLYFASDWHHGLGGLDIFSADIAGAAFTDVRNLGKGVNSSYDDLSYTKLKPGTYAFVSNRNPDKLEDIFIQKKELPTYIVQVNDKQGNAIPNIQLDLSACNLGIKTTNANGQIILNQKPNGCTVRAKGSNFNDYNGLLTFTNNKAVLPLEKIERIRVEGIVQSVEGKPLSNTKIAVKGDKIGINGLSDSNGKYAFNLKNDFTYTMTFEKDGYETKELSITTNAANKTLPTVSLSPIAQPISEPPVVENTTKQPAIKAEEKMVARSAEEVVEAKEPVTVSKSVEERTNVAPTKEVSEPKPMLVSKKSEVKENAINRVSEDVVEATQPAVTKGGTSFKEIYVVQLGAFSGDVDLNKFSAISKLGELYVHQESGLNKVRLGKFSTRAEANSALAKAKSQGFKGYVLDDKIPINVSPLKNISKIEESTPVEATVAANEKVTYTAKTVSSTSVATSNVLVRLAAYKEPKWFQAEKFGHIANIYKQEKGEWTIFYLDGFQSIQEAQSAREEAKRLGFKSAYLVEKQGDSFRRM